MTSYVALDIGNVLYRCEFDPFIKYLSKELNISFEDAKYFLVRTQKLHDLGLTTINEELRDYFNIKSPVRLEEISDVWRSTAIPDIKILQELKYLTDNKDLKIALLSNIGLEHSNDVDIVLNAISLKCIKHFSCFVGARKPTDLFYQSFLMKHPEFAGCLYIDDLEDNLNAGINFGFKPFKFSLESEDSDILLKKIWEIIP